MDRAHLNRDFGNTTCFCTIGADHGNLPFEIRAAVIAHQLSGVPGVTLENLRGDVMVRIEKPGDTPRAFEALRSYGPHRSASHERDGRGLLVSAAAFNG